MDDLRRYLEVYKPKPSADGYLFPGSWGKGHLHEEYASLIFREGCKRADIEGASTHICRRTALTIMHRNNVPLRVIQEISGHQNSCINFLCYINRLSFFLIYGAKIVELLYKFLNKWFLIKAKIKFSTINLSSLKLGAEL